MVTQIHLDCKLCYYVYTDDHNLRLMLFLTMHWNTCTTCGWWLWFTQSVSCAITYILIIGDLDSLSICMPFYSDGPATYYNTNTEYLLWKTGTWPECCNMQSLSQFSNLILVQGRGKPYGQVACKQCTQLWPEPLHLQLSNPLNQSSTTENPEWKYPLFSWCPDSDRLSTLMQQNSLLIMIIVFLHSCISWWGELCHWTM